MFFFLFYDRIVCQIVFLRFSLSTSGNMRKINIKIRLEEGMKENVEHIDIPFDELKIFTTAGEEDAFQEILIEST